MLCPNWGTYLQQKENKKDIFLSFCKQNISKKSELFSDGVVVLFYLIYELS